MSKMMKAGVLYGPEDVRLEEVEVPKVGPGEVLVRVGAALTCGTDAKVYRRGGHPRMIRPPAVFGHELAGEVESVGDGVAGFRPGDRVVPANSAPCGACLYCRLDKPSLCQDMLYINGAYAQFALIPERIVQKNLLRVPDHVPYAAAALTEPLACVVHGIQESNIQVGDRVGVIGAGPIGLFFVKLAKLRGAIVVSADLVAERLEMARRLGADRVVDASETEDMVSEMRRETPDEEGLDVVIEATGVPAVWESAVKMARKSGTVNLFGGCAPDTSVTFDTSRIHYDQLTIKGVYHHTPDCIRRALALIAAGDIDVEAFIHRELPLERLEEALKLIVDRNGEKTAVIP